MNRRPSSNPRRSKSPLYESPKRTDIDEEVKNRRESGLAKQKREEEEKECTFSPVTYSSYKLGNQGSMESREQSREENKRRMTVQALTEFLNDHPFSPNGQKVGSGSEMKGSGKSAKKVSERLYNNAIEKEKKKKSKQEEYYGKLFKPTINQKSKELAEKNPDRKEKLYRSKYDSKKDVDYFVVSDEVDEVSRKDRGNSELIKKSPLSQETAAGFTPSNFKMRREDDRMNNGPQVAPFETDSIETRSKKSKEREFISFYDNETDPDERVRKLKKPQEAALSPQNNSKGKKGSPDSRNVFFPSQVNSLDSFANKHLMMDGLREKSNDFIESEMVNVTGRNEESSKQFSPIITHHIRKGERNPDLVLHLLKTEEDEEFDATNMVTPHGSLILGRRLFSQQQLFTEREE